jgi:hypothetical protein
VSNSGLSCTAQNYKENFHRLGGSIQFSVSP